MDGKGVQAQASRCAEQLPQSELTHPFGDDWEVYKVRGKVFMLQTDITGEPIVILKADPAESQALQATQTDVTPATT